MELYAQPQETEVIEAVEVVHARPTQTAPDWRTTAAAGKVAMSAKEREYRQKKTCLDYCQNRL